MKAPVGYTETNPTLGKEFWVFKSFSPNICMGSPSVPKSGNLFVERHIE
jgi:hypothetical protein